MEETRSLKNIGYNVPSTMEEREEDLLEILYGLWKSGRAAVPEELCMQMEIEKEALDDLMCRMVWHGYLKDAKDLSRPELTEYGKAQGAECRDRHLYLSCFLQMTCGLDEQQAQENACRIEHVVGDEVMEGVCKFLKFGDIYERVMRNVDLNSIYKAGQYTFCGSIYCSDKRYPRTLAPESDLFSDQILLEVGWDRCFFYLLEKEQGMSGPLWYKGENEWEMAPVTEKGIQIPTEAFIYTFSSDYPISEADGMIAFTSEGIPTDQDCRELNIHIW